MRKVSGATRSQQPGPSWAPRVQLQVKPDRDWAVHVEVMDVADKVHRISVSNIYKTAKVRRGGAWPFRSCRLLSLLHCLWRMVL